MNKKLTIKERVGLPETNSSSSHAIVINDLNDKEYLSELLEYINSDNILELPSSGDFDFGNCSFSSSNNIIKKIMFVIALFSTRTWGNDSIIKISKFLNYLGNIIKSFTGVKDVKFESISKYNEMLGNFEDDSDYESFEDIDYEYRTCSFGNVDHQSMDLYEELFQNKDTLKNFIFSKDSWLFLGSDCYNMDIKIYEILSEEYKDELEELTNYATIDFGSNLGKVDIPLNNSGSIINDIMCGRDNLVESIRYKDGLYTISSDYSGITKDDNVLSPEHILLYKSFGEIVTTGYSYPIVSFENKQGLYLYLTNQAFRKSLSKVSEMNQDTSFGDLINSVKDNFVEGKDWLEIRIYINNKDYGIL